MPRIVWMSLGSPARSILPRRRRTQHVHDVGLRVEGPSPDFFEDHRPRQGATRVAQKTFQQREFLGLECDVSGPPVHLSVESIQAQVSHGKDGRWGGRLVAGADPAGEREQAGGQLVEGKGFDEVIVGSRSQPTHPVVHGIQRAEHEHRAGDAPAPATCAKRQSR